jgi:hypothetical protein
MKNALVIHYSQSGQLTGAVKSTLRHFENHPECTVTYTELKPLQPFPFPWTYSQFWDAFAETVKGIPCEMQPLEFDRTVNYDLIILAYQPWFLSPSRPVDSFLQSAEAKQLLNGKPVVTILACRNMWLNAQERVKIRLRDIGAQLVGNITYVDRSSNLVSLITVLAFALGGEKGRYLGIFPKYGVPQEELNSVAWRYGDILMNHLQKGSYNEMQAALVQAGAVKIKTNLMMMEGRGKILFPIYADFILKKGKANSHQRRTRSKAFGIILPILILILSPVITIVSRLMPLLFRTKARKEVEYFSGVTLR